MYERPQTRRKAEDHSVAAGPSPACCAVELTIGALGQVCVRPFAIQSHEAVECCQLAGRSDFVDRARAEAAARRSRMIFEGLFENYYYWHRFDDAIQTMSALQSRDAVEFENAPFSWAFGNAYLAKGMYPEAEAIYRQLADRYRIDLYFLRLAQAQALEGHRTEARAVVERVERNPDRTADPVSLARVHVALGETDAAIAWLQRPIRSAIRTLRL